MSDLLGAYRPGLILYALHIAIIPAKDLPTHAINMIEQFNSSMYQHLMLVFANMQVQYVIAYTGHAIITNSCCYLCMHYSLCITHILLQLPQSQGPWP